MSLLKPDLFSCCYLPLGGKRSNVNTPLNSCPSELCQNSELELCLWFPLKRCSAGATFFRWGGGGHSIRAPIGQCPIACSDARPKHSKPYPVGLMNETIPPNTSFCDSLTLNINSTRFSQLSKIILLVPGCRSSLYGYNRCPRIIFLN